MEVSLLARHTHFASHVRVFSHGVCKRPRCVGDADKEFFLPLSSIFSISSYHRNFVCLHTINDIQASDYKAPKAMQAHLPEAKEPRDIT